MAPAGLVVSQSRHGPAETMQKLVAAVTAKGLAVLAHIDHAGAAAKAGMALRPTDLLIFGNPKGGTPLMLAAPSIALDLPLKILVAEDAQGKVTVSYNSAEYLKQRHGLPENLLANIAVIQTLAEKAAE